MLKLVFLSKIFNLSSLAFETKRKRLIGGKLAIVLTFFFSQVSFLTFSQTSLFPEESLDLTFQKSEEPGHPVQEREVKYQPNSGGVKVLTTAKSLVREYLYQDRNFSYDIVKVNGGFSADFLSVINPEHMSRSMWNSFKDDFSGDAVFYPTTFTVGAKLPDAFGKIKILQADNSLFYQEFSLTNREVLATETIIISGTTQSAYVLTSTYTFKGNSLNTSEKITHWIVPGKGIVKELRLINGKQIITEIK